MHVINEEGNDGKSVWVMHQGQYVNIKLICPCVPFSRPMSNKILPDRQRINIVHQGLIIVIEAINLNMVEEQRYM